VATFASTTSLSGIVTPPQEVFLDFPANVFEIVVFIHRRRKKLLVGSTATSTSLSDLAVPLAKDPIRNARRTFLSSAKKERSFFSASEFILHSLLSEWQPEAIIPATQRSFSPHQVLSRLKKRISSCRGLRSFLFPLVCYDIPAQRTPKGRETMKGDARVNSRKAAWTSPKPGSFSVSKPGHVWKRASKALSIG